MTKTHATWLLVGIVTGSSFGLFYASRNQSDEKTIAKIFHQEMQLLKAELSIQKSASPPTLDSRRDYGASEKNSTRQHLQTPAIADYSAIIDELKITIREIVEDAITSQMKLVNENSQGTANNHGVQHDDFLAEYVTSVDSNSTEYLTTLDDINALLDAGKSSGHWGETEMESFNNAKFKLNDRDHAEALRKFSISVNNGEFTVDPNVRIR